MARPIQPTPILEGEDARRVLDELDNPIFDPKKERFLKECKKIYESIDSSL